MPAADTPAAEVDVDATLVRSLLAEQRPDLAALPLSEAATGWDNVLFRLGDDLCVRLPRRSVAAPLVEHEQRWLPTLAPHLPLPVPVPVHAGRPGAGYPWAWSVVPWLPGEIALHAPPADPDAAALALGRFVAALHGVAAPPDAPANPWRGIPLAHRDERLRSDLDRVGPAVDRAAVLDCWSTLVAVPAWTGPPTWLHGDLHPGNVLVADGAIAGVIDFGDLTSGDPAGDLGIAWMLLPPPARAVFRSAVGDVDDDTWQRGRGWALAVGMAIIGSSADNPAFTDLGVRTVAAALEG